MENAIVRDNSGKFVKGHKKLPGAGERKSNKQVKKFKTALFRYANEIVADPVRMESIPDECIIKLAAAWGMKIDVANQTGQNPGDNNIILIHNVPDKKKIEENIIDVTKEVVEIADKKVFDPKKMGQFNPNLPPDADLRKPIK